jgi:hypothetical protein
MLNGKIVWDERYGQGSYNFYKQAKEVERQINNDDFVIGTVLRVNDEIRTRIAKILERSETDNIGRAIDYCLRSTARYLHRMYYIKDGHKYMATIDLVLKKFILEID